MGGERVVFLGEAFHNKCIGAEINSLTSFTSYEETYHSVTLDSDQLYQLFLVESCIISTEEAAGSGVYSMTYGILPDKIMIS